MPFFSKQKGRMSALLKQKSKIATKKKDRIKYEPHQTLKRLRDPAPLLPSPSQQPTQATQPTTKPGQTNTGERKTIKKKNSEW